MVFQIKHARETRAGEIRLAPRAVLMLVVNEIRNGFADGRIAEVRSREQTDQSPGGLRTRAGALPFGPEHLVACKRFSEAAVDLLHRAKPDHDALSIIASGQQNCLPSAE